MILLFTFSNNALGIHDPILRPKSPPPYYLSNPYLESDDRESITRFLEVTGLRGDCPYNPWFNESPKLYLVHPNKEKLTVILSAVAQWVQEASGSARAPQYEVLDGRASFKGTYNALIDLEDIINYGLKPESYTKITDPWQRLKDILEEKTADLEPTVSEENLEDLLAIREAPSTQNG